MNIVVVASVESNARSYFTSFATVHATTKLVVAGITMRSPFIDEPHEDFLRVLDVNLVGPYALAKEVSRHMKERGYGRIINIGSVLSILGRSSIQPYNCTKHAVNGLTKGEKGTRVFVD